MTATKRKRTSTAPQKETLPVVQPTYHPILVKDHAGEIHTHYLSDFGVWRINELTASGRVYNEALLMVVPNAVISQTPECITMLGLDWPCDAATVKRRYRELSLKHHPDVGGAAAEFIAATKYFNEAINLFDEEADGVR